MIFCIWLDGTLKVVPSPQRLQLIQQVYEDLGHFGVQSSYSVLRGMYW